MVSPLKVGLVGFGGAGISQLWHFQELGCEVVSIFDTKPGALKRAINRSKSVFTTDNFGEFLESGIEVVSICSPDRTHADYFAKSIGAGKHTITEKPLADSLEGCRQILAAVSQMPSCVAAAQHQMRFLPVHVAMKRLVDEGNLGKLSYIEGYYVHNLTERASTYDRWRFDDNATPLLYSGCHFVDLLRWLLDDEVVEVAGMANNVAFPEYPESDMNIVLLRFRSGVIGKVVTGFGFGRPQDHSVRIYGSDKCIDNNLLFSKDGSFSVFARPSLPKVNPSWSFRRKYRTWRPFAKSVGLSRIIEPLLRMKGLAPEYAVSAYPQRLYEHSYAVRTSLEDFLNAIRRQTQPSCTVMDAAKTVATCLAGVEAYRTGRTVQVADYWLPEFKSTSRSSENALRPGVHALPTPSV